MPNSVKDDVEYGGYLYKTADGNFSYAEPVPGEYKSVDPGNFNCIPEGTKKAGMYHTHQANDRMSPFISMPDTLSAGLEGVPIYMGTPQGLIKEFTPGKGESTVRRH